jgi:peptidoglycan/LPS O-acetylase OafA/YrhL
MQWLRRRLTGLGLATALVFVVGIPLTHAYSTERLAGQTIGYTVLAACGAVFVTLVALSAGRRGAGVNAVLKWAPLRSCGRYSYAMYIFHNLLHKLVGEPRLLARFGEHLPAPTVFVYAIAVLAVSYLLGLASYHLLEKHFLRLKRLFETRSAGPRSG